MFSTNSSDRWVVGLVLSLGLAQGVLLGQPAKPSGGQESTSKLPLTRLTLYSSGVGYFQRTGEVEGKAEVELRFKVDDINDLLKSMVVQDFGGGQVQTVTYGSRDPITKTLKSFGLDLTENPTLGQLLNEGINGEFRQALGVLAKGHDTQKKTVSITFNGQGKRKVSVGYIAQTPVWKTSYRLVLGDQDQAFLQGWAIVENTSDEDWADVDLSLISGRPISFVMDLYQPLYTVRPVVEPELYLSLRPQVYTESLESKAAGATQNNFKRDGRFAGSQMNAQMQLRQQMPGSTLSPDVANGALALSDGISAVAEGAQAGELFQYHIKSSVSLGRQKSALLPIINDSVKGSKVSIYNARVQAKYPLNGLRFKNSTGLHLMQGPVTVFDANTYAGDARIDDLAPEQVRLISYGVDLRAEVESRATAPLGEVTKVVIRHGTVVLTRKLVQEMTYTVRNRDQKKKTVLIEHPYQSDWVLLGFSEKPERSRDVYRFPVVVEAGKAEKLVVKEEKLTDELTELSNSPDDFIAILIKGEKATPKIQEALKEVMKMRAQLSETTAQRTRRELEVAGISQEQVRIRENMAKLTQNSELHTRYIKKLDAQETVLEGFQTEITQLKDKESQQKLALDQFLTRLNLE